MNCLDSKGAYVQIDPYILVFGLDGIFRLSSNLGDELDPYRYGYPIAFWTELECDR